MLKIHIMAGTDMGSRVSFLMRLLHDPGRPKRKRLRSHTDFIYLAGLEANPSVSVAREPFNAWKYILKVFKSSFFKNKSIASPSCVPMKPVIFTIAAPILLHLIITSV